MSTTIYSIEGKVISRNQLGRTIGFPTANLSLTSLDSPINKGVYGVTVSYSNKDYL
ncbi:hypothetical protein ELQ35_21945 [Peribacillus cavernae]|uniref:riboflavin kinase n=1 Tax=Peribacillus cavernae TaxID=1674310 RepID=A0A433H7D5_9BACI|nr:riboflavin kinase [Peribacillus cavernae]MDQ0218637.1 FAD synthase [Peribacillus cavernae]RUQ24231.1 hypothetical protein ELQ35_21945 [Peribacillus cavernae]